MTKTLKFEVQEHLSANSRTHYFQVDGENRGSSCLPFNLEETFGPYQCGDRFQVEQEVLGDGDEVVFRVKRLKPNPKNAPRICPFTARRVAKTKRPSREAEPDLKRYRSLRDAFRRIEAENEKSDRDAYFSKRVWVHVVCDNGDVRSTSIEGFEVEYNHAYVQLAGFPFLMHVSRVHLVSRSPFKKVAA